MPLELALDYVAPIPTGHRVQVIRAQRWVTPAFGPARWSDVPVPLVVDLDTSVVFCGDGLGESLVPSPLAFKPDSRLQVAGMTEGRVTSCIVSTDRIGETFIAKTYLVVEQSA